MPTSQKVTALIVVAMAALGALYTVLSGNEPLLGLDLQGGVSVVLEPTEDEPTEEALELTVELLRARIDEIGVAEPEISLQGNNIVVALPGLVQEQESALARLRQTAELRFRPVLTELGPELVLPSDDTDESDAGDGETGDGDEEGSLGESGVMPVGLTAQSTDTGTDDGETDEPAEPGNPADELDVPADPFGNVITECLALPTTPDEEDDLTKRVVLLDEQGGRFCLGPAQIENPDQPGQLRDLTGEMIETADVGLSALGWQVNLTLNSDDPGIARFNDASAVCFNRDFNICPSGQLAVVLDHEVISAPNIQAASFQRDRIQITGGGQNGFEEDEARALAEALRFGALPLELVAQDTDTVSASIGQDVLTSGVIAGLIGLALVAVYLLAYYRLAGLVAISGLLLSAALLWTIIAWFGETFGLALSLAGVVGLIVSIGVSTDSNIVYFENVKDSYRAGRRIPTAVERAYESAISTIVKADVVSLIAAVLLYLLTVGAVRGFAFYLGLATILDLIISWMFMRPALAWLARRPAVEENPRLLGLPATGGAQ